MNIIEKLLKEFIEETVKRCNKKDKQKGKPYCLYTKDGSQVLGHHKTVKDAYAQEKAIEMNEATNWNSVQEMYVDGQWYSITDSDTHNKFAERYYRKYFPKSQNLLHANDPDFSEFFVKDFNAIRRNGDSYIVKNFDTKNLRILQEHIMDTNPNGKFSVWSLIPTQSIFITKDELLLAKSFHDMEIANSTESYSDY